MNIKQEYKEAYRRVRIEHTSFPSLPYSIEMNIRNKRLSTCQPVHVWILKCANQSYFNLHYT